MWNLIAVCLYLAAFWILWKKCRTTQAPEEDRDPCEDCLRWEECNGVDESCPMRAGGYDGYL